MSEAIAYYAHTMPGVERIAWLEIRRRFPRARLVEFIFAKDKNGIVVFNLDADPNELLDLRTTEDVFVTLFVIEKLSRGWQDLRAIENTVCDLPELDGMLAQAAPGGRKDTLSYRVISRKEGLHQYRRVDLEQAVIKGVERRHAHALKLVDDHAQIEIWANVLGSKLLCGVRLSDRGMRHRDYQTTNLPAALRPSVAAAMVLLTQPRPDDVFLDPMCGSGTILAERVLAGTSRLVLGGDIERPRVSVAAETLQNITAASAVVVCQWDACQLPVADASVDKVSTNLPFGKKIATPSDVGRLYPLFFRELSRVLKPQGKATVLSSEFDLVKDVVRGESKLHIETGYSIAVLGQWARIYLVTRLP
jgi:23S rRNA G2445 N2-methylase RlmL